MAASGTRPTKSRVLIAGGGFAAVEAALALRALAGELAQLTLISPDSVLRYRPAATVEAFQGVAPRNYGLAAIAGEVGAAFHRDRLESVASLTHSVRTAGGARMQYDALILATGVRAVAAIPGALMFRDQRDVPLIKQLLEEIDAGRVRRVAFAVPPGSCWPLPAYELALLAARRAADSGRDLDVALVTPETAPLALFGTRASCAVRELLSAKRVAFVGGSCPRGVLRDGSLALAFDAPIRADRVVAVPELRGRRITGVPASWQAFVPVDAHGRVEGLSDVYAAGDMTTFPVKQGGLAAQQSDRIAHGIAASLGAPVRELRPTHVLQARLIGGEAPLVLRAELDSQGRPTASEEHADRAAAFASEKVFGRYLTPYLETTPALAA